MIEVQKLKEIVIDLSEIELSTTSHDDYIEDYKNPLEFYLSNAEQDSYFMNYIPSVFPFVSREEAIEIQKMVIDIIKQKESEQYISMSA